MVRFRRPAARAFHAAIVVLVVLALALQLWITAKAGAAPPGHAVGTLAGTSLGGRILRTLSFFTVLSNILSAVTSAQLARDPDRDGPAWRIVRLASVFSIAVTGVVYGTVLARVHEPHGWKETTTNTVFHYIVPIAMILGWLLFGPRPRITGRTIAIALVWPIVWLGYALVLGESTGWYPYPFLDVATQGYGRVLINAVGVVAVFAVVNAVLWFGDRRLPPLRDSART